MISFFRYFAYLINETDIYTKDREQYDLLVHTEKAMGNWTKGFTKKVLKEVGLKGSKQELLPHVNNYLAHNEGTAKTYYRQPTMDQLEEVSSIMDRLRQNVVPQVRNVTRPGNVHQDN